MTRVPTHLDPLPKIDQRAGATTFSVATTNPALEAVRDAVQRRLPELVAAVVPDASAAGTLLEQDRQDVTSTAKEILTRSTPEREAASAGLAASTAALRDRLVATTHDTVQRFLVDTADGIFTTGGGALNLVEIHTGPTPENNFARFTLDDAHHGRGFATGSDSVTFDFTWRNDSRRTVSADVHGYLVLDGSAVTLCDGGWIALNSSTMDVIPTMAVFDDSTNPPIELPTQEGDSTLALHLSCEAFGVIEPGQIDGEDIFRGYDLQHTGVVVPPGGQLRVHLSLVFNISIVGDGRVQAGFATAPRRLLTPGVLFVTTDM
jgi:hypothetical protein